EAAALAERHARQFLDGAGELAARDIAARAGGGKADERAHASGAADRRGAPPQPTPAEAGRDRRQRGARGAAQIVELVAAARELLCEARAAELDARGRGEALALVEHDL